MIFGSQAVCTTCMHALTAAGCFAVQITTADGEQSGLRPILLGKSPSAVALSTETAAPGDGREVNKREIKRKQVVIAKDKELTTVSI